MEKLPSIPKAAPIELERPHPPYSGLSTILQENIVRVFTSPCPTYEPAQHTGIKWFAQSLYAAGFRKGDIIINTFTYHMSTAGILFNGALRDCGATKVRGMLADAKTVDERTWQ